MRKESYIWEHPNYDTSRAVAAIAEGHINNAPLPSPTAVRIARKLPMFRGVPVTAVAMNDDGPEVA